MNNSLRISITSALLLLSFLCIASGSLAADTWIPEFEDICGKTQDAEALSKDELKSLVSRCDKLKPLIANSDNPQKSVYLFRLDKCKKLFAYMIEISNK